MSDFERDIVHCLNRFFKTHNIQGFAYRLRQSRFESHCMAVLVDSIDPSYHLSIECKSIIDKKLYFSQHFHPDRNKVHPVHAITDFLLKTGRIGFLAVEFRQGPGKVSEAFLLPWSFVVSHYKTSTGITVEDARSGIVLGRTKAGYQLESLDAK